MKYYTFLTESTEDSIIKNIAKNSISSAINCRTIIEAKCQLYFGYQKCLSIMLTKELPSQDIKYIHVLEHCYLQMNKHGTKWKDYLKKIMIKEFSNE